MIATTDKQNFGIFSLQTHSATEKVRDHLTIQQASGAGIKEMLQRKCYKENAIQKTVVVGNIYPY